MSVLGQMNVSRTTPRPAVGIGPALLSIAAVARMFGVSVPSVRGMIVRGDLDEKRIGRRRLVTRGSVSRFLEGRSP